MVDESGDAPQSALERFATGVPGLDEVLRGGLVRGGSYLVLGEAGTGKTTLGSHVAFRHAAAGGTVLFVTVLAEPHDRMLQHLSGFAFFAADQVGRSIYFVSLYDELREHGLGEGLALLRRIVRERGATLLVVDGAARFQDFAGSSIEHRRFVAELHAQLALLDCTAILLAQSGSGEEVLHGVGTHVDGIVVLEDESIDERGVRRLRVLKLRGTNTLRGWHQFAITDAGVEVYPRLEATAVPARPLVPGPRRRLPLGIDGLDAMLQGGVLTATTTLVIGPPGIGKTTVGLQFIAEGAEREERGLIAGFQEAPDRLVAKADALGLGLGGHVRDGRVRIGWQPSMEGPLDAWGHELLEVAAEHRPQRLLVDALTDVARLPGAEGRLPAFAAALAHALRARGVTTIFTAEGWAGVGADREDPFLEAASAIDNTLLLRYAEPRSRLHRLVAIGRARDSGFAPAAREFTITDHGIEVASTAESAEAVLGDANRRNGTDRRNDGG